MSAVDEPSLNRQEYDIIKTYVMSHIDLFNKRGRPFESMKPMRFGEMDGVGAVYLINTFIDRFCSYLRKQYRDNLEESQRKTLREMLREIAPVVSFTQRAEYLNGLLNEPKWSAKQRKLADDLAQQYRCEVYSGLHIERPAQPKYEGYGGDTFEVLASDAGRYDIETDQYGRRVRWSYLIYKKNDPSNDREHRNGSEWLLYRLWRDGLVVYVGITKDIVRRVREHEEKKDFDDVSFILIGSKDDAYLVEQHQIKAIQPIYNRQRIRSSGRPWVSENQLMAALRFLPDGDISLWNPCSEARQGLLRQALATLSEPPG